MLSWINKGFIIIITYIHYHYKLKSHIYKAKITLMFATFNDAKKNIATKRLVNANIFLMEANEIILTRYKSLFCETIPLHLPFSFSWR